MQVLDEEMETIHLYVVREQPKQPYSLLPLFGAFLCLLGIAALTLYSAQHPYYEHERLTVPAIPLPLKVFSAQVPIIPTGVKTYPATTAHGFLTFSNGSVIGQSVPAGFTIDGTKTDRAIYVPPATANGFGMSTVSAHLLASGSNMPTLAINEVVGSSLFIRNLTPFTGGKDGYSVSYATVQDKQIALMEANKQPALVAVGSHYPCLTSGKRVVSVSKEALSVTWRCQFATYRVPSYMRVTEAKLVGKNFLIDVTFIPRPVRLWAK
jgi:hypothetical protein